MCERVRTKMFISLLCIMFNTTGYFAESAYRLKSVTRKYNTGETDIISFNGTCPSSLCERINGFSLSNTGCTCRCGNRRAYVISEKNCFTYTDLNGAFIISQAASPTRILPKVTSQQLTDGLPIFHCPKPPAPCSKGFDCKIDINDSEKNTEKSWEKIWHNENDVQFKIVHNFQSESRLLFKSTADKQQFNGMLLKIALQCNVNGGEAISFSAFEVVGTYLVSGIFQQQPTTSATVSHPSTVNVISNVFTLPGSKDNTPTQGKQKKTSKSKMDMLIVALVLALLLIISCILLVFMFRRWRHAKNRTNNHMTEPNLSFQATTPVFLVGDRSNNSFKGEHNQQPEILSTNDLISNSAPDQEKKNGTIRALYASIDKFFKSSTKRKSNGSLDEGYTTDDNYDYRRFTAFPKELYDQPGSIISSFDEPDYKIPEDFEANVPYESETTETDGPYLRPVIPDSSSDGLSQSGEHHYDHVKDKVENESPYDEVGEVLSAKVSISLETLPCPFEADSGNMLNTRTKLTILQNQKKTVNPYDKVGKIMSTKGSNKPDEKLYIPEELYECTDSPIDTKDTVSRYDEVGTVLVDKCKLPKQNKTKRNEATKLTRQNEITDTNVNPYDEVGTVVRSSVGNKLEHKYDDPKEPVEYDEPENDVQYDEPEVEKRKSKPPKPPRPDSFEVVINRHAHIEIDV